MFWVPARIEGEKQTDTYQQQQPAGLFGWTPRFTWRPLRKLSPLSCLKKKNRKEKKKEL